MGKSDKERIAVLEEQNSKNDQTVGIILSKLDLIPDLVGKKIEDKFAEVEKLNNYKAIKQAEMCERRGKVVDKLQKWVEKEKIYIGVFATIILALWNLTAWFVDILIKKFF